MGILRRYVRSAGALTAQALVARLIGMASNVVLARGLGASGLGTYTAVMNTGSSVYGLLRFGTDAGIHVLTAEGHPQARLFSPSDVLAAGFLLLTLSGTIGAAFCIAMAGFLAERVYGSADLAPWLTAASAIVFAQCLSQFFYAALAGVHQFGRYAVVTSLGALGGLVLLIGGIWIGELKGAVAAAIATQWLTMLGMAAVFISGRPRQAGKIIPGSRHLIAAGVGILQVGFPFYLAGLLSVPVYYVAQGALAQSSGLEAVGYLRVIQAITGIIVFIPASMAAATVSTLSAVRSDPDSGNEQYGYLAFLNLRTVWIFGLFAALVTYSLLPAIMAILFGDMYRSAVAPARVAVLAAALTVIVNAASHGYFAERRVGRIFWQVVLQTTVFGILAALLIPGFGIMGYVTADLAGWAAAWSAVVILAVHFRRDSGLSPRPLLVMFAATMISFLLLLYLAMHAPADETVTQFVCLVLGAISALACWRWGLEPAERERAKSVGRMLPWSQIR